MKKQSVVTGCDLGGSGTDLAADMSLIQNLLSQKCQTLHFFLIDKHLLLPALNK